MNELDLAGWAGERLGHAFQNLGLLRQALTHPSFAYEAGDLDKSNQRLEFLGDAVLGLVAAGLVYHEFSHWPEGKLTKAKSALVSAPVLGKRARQLEIGARLRFGRGEARMGGPERESNLADAFEAIVGALYLDGGMAVAQAFVEQELRPELVSAATGRLAPNFKATLLELAQSRQQGPPTYEVTSVAGREHEPEFQVRVRVAGRMLGEGVGASKKAAEQAAARAALAWLSAHHRETGPGDT